MKSCKAERRLRASVITLAVIITMRALAALWQPLDSVTYGTDETSMANLIGTCNSLDLFFKILTISIYVKS